MKLQIAKPEVSLLTICSEARTEALVEKVCRRSQWRLLRASSQEEANSIIRRDDVHVVLSEDSPDCNWRDLLQDLRQLKNPPLLVVTSRLADEHLWAEVLNMGGYDVLAQPLIADEVERVIDAASRQFISHSRHHMAALMA